MAAQPLHADLPRRVLVADDESLVATHIAHYLAQLGVEVVGPAHTGSRAVELAQLEKPDMALLDIRMPQVDGLAAADTLYQRMGIPVILLSAFSDPAYIRHGATIGVFGYLIKPVNADELRAALAVAWSRFQQQSSLHAQVDELKLALEERKLVERAKGMLMEQMNMTEQAAMRRLQKHARDTRRKLAEVSRSLIEGEETLGPDSAT